MEYKDLLLENVNRLMSESQERAAKNLRWIGRHMHPYFFITMKGEPTAVSTLACELQSLKVNKQLVLADREEVLIVVRQDRPGSLYETLNTLKEREISYTEIIHSEKPPPGLEKKIEIQTFRFERKDASAIAGAGQVSIPREIEKGVFEEIRQTYPDFDPDKLDRNLRILWLNNQDYVRLSPYKRTAQILHLFQMANEHGGVYFDVEDIQWPGFPGEYRVRFAAGNPPQKGFLLQLMEAFNRLGIGIRRTYCLAINTGIHPYFLGTFYVRAVHGSDLAPGGQQFNALRSELFNSDRKSVV